MRRFVLILALCIMLTTVSTRAASAGGSTVVGEITSIAGSSVNPTGFTLQTVARTLTIRIPPNARFVPRSAEAAVEGFGIGDYATVVISGPAYDLAAKAVRFDVRPWPALKRFPLIGTVLRAGPNGKWFSLRSLNARTWQVRITPKTEFLSAGVALAAQQPLYKGEKVAIVAKNGPVHPIALAIDISPVTVSARIRLTRGHNARDSVV
ncbi:MAG TPA: hypothetical protein VFA78_09560 [Chloroflexota bacterium]|nr:hypothetical protein [Chloroflexota bacterium]